jgi:hypothetical protein
MRRLSCSNLKKPILSCSMEKVMRGGKRKEENFARIGNTSGKRSGARSPTNVPSDLHWILPQILFPTLDSSSAAAHKS